jgi:parallel beta-helix repeat protein
MKKQFYAILLSLTIISALVPQFHSNLDPSLKLQSDSLNSSEQQAIALVNGSRAYGYDLELENITLKHPAFRAAGSSGAYEAANWIEGQFESFGLNSSLESFQFTNWTLLSRPFLVIDEDGNSSTVNDQVVIDSFECEHYSWPTPYDGVFADLVVLPLPPAVNLGEIGVNPINMTEWDNMNTTGKIVLIGREIRWNGYWQQTFVNKLTVQTPAAVVYTWWYPWMNFTPTFFSSAGGRPLSGFGSYYWDLKIPVGFVNYEDGLWIRDVESANSMASANVTIRSVINDGIHYNVIGKITGYTNPEKLVVISGHYDTVMCSGFCDNGAGVAGILELAKVFADAAQREIYKPNYTLVFVAFTGEELDLVGSAQYVKLHKNEMANITAIINLDSIGSDNLYVTKTPGSDLNQTIIEAAQDLGINITSEEVGGSDQESFRAPGIVDSDIAYYWGVDLGIYDASPVNSSAMLDSYPLFYNDFWNMGKPGWIHTPYDNSTSTETQGWVEVSNLENHIKVAALTIMRVSPNAVIPPPPPPPPPSRLIIVPDNYTTIQEAVDNANDNDTIFVRNGTYHEHVSVDKKVLLIGENKDATIIYGNGTGTVVQLGTNVTITNFTIRNGEYGVRILQPYGNIPVYRDNIVNNTKIIDNRYGAILIRACANNTIINNLMVNNTLFGIHLWHAGDNTIINNTVVNNGYGIDFYGNSNDNILRNNNMTDNTYNFGLILREETRNFFTRTSSKPGIVNDVDSSNTVNGKPIYYLVNQSDEQIPSDAGYIWLNNCTNITINGCNLSSNLQGILLLFTNNASIINNKITNNANGIYVGVVSSNNTLIGNTLEDNVNGIYLDDASKFTTMRNNIISGGQMNFGVSPDIARHITSGSDLINNIDTSNTVEGKPIIYWINQHDLQVPTNAGYVMLINSTNIQIENLELTNNIQNIFLLASNDTIIENSSITNSVYGIVISDYGWYDSNSGITYRFYSFNTTIKGNILVDNGVGIWIRSNNSTVTDNTLNRNPLGICLAGTSNSTISKNVVTESNTNAISPSPPPDLYIFYYPTWPWEYSRELVAMEMGGIIVGGEHNIIYGNTVRDNCIGIFMFDQTNNIFGVSNTVFYNNFINNTPYQAMGPPRGSNNFDNSYLSGGNYWSNYNGTDLFSGPYRNETGSDGIGDTAFQVFPGPQQVVDNYPLMAPINIFDAGIWNGTNQDISIISNSSISNFQINKTQNTISFNVTHQTSLVFFRVSIPNVIANEFWQGNCTLLVNGQQVETRNWTDESNTYIYFTHEDPKQVTMIPESPSLLVMLLLIIATLLAVIVRRRKSHQTSQLLH